MRWEELFEDLEAQLDAGSRRVLDLEVADRTRRERATVPLMHRLGASVGKAVDISVVGAAEVRGTLVDVGADWVLVLEGLGRPSLVPLSAVLSVSGLAGPLPPAAPGASAAAPAVGHPGAGAHAVTPGPARPTSDDGAGRRFGFGFALRALSRDRATVSLVDVAGRTLTGTIDAVGADAFDFAEHPADLPPRPENVTARRAMTFSGVAVVRPG